MSDERRQCWWESPLPEVEEASPICPLHECPPVECEPDLGIHVTSELLGWTKDIRAVPGLTGLHDKDCVSRSTGSAIGCDCGGERIGIDLCQCGHSAEEHTPEADSGSGMILCRYDCSVPGCQCEMYRHINLSSSQGGA